MTQYSEFLEGVKKSNWMTRAAVGSKVVSAEDEDEDEDEDGDGRVANRWTAAHSFGIAAGATISIISFVVGLLLVSGVILFSTELVSALLPLPVEPVPAAPHGPSAPPGTLVYATSTCSISIAGIEIDRTNNGLCEDGGAGATSSDCQIGTDFPDCDVRSAPHPPPLPSVPPPFLPSPLAPGAQFVVFTPITFWLEESCEAFPSSPPSSPPSPPSPPSHPSLYARSRARIEPTWATWAPPKSVRVWVLGGAEPRPVWGLGGAEPRPLRPSQCLGGAEPRPGRGGAPPQVPLRFAWLISACVASGFTFRYRIKSATLLA